MRFDIDRLTGDRSEKAGTAPGTLDHVGTERVAEPVIHVLDYDADGCTEDEVAPDAVADELDSGTKTWVNVDGLHEEGVVQAIGEHIGLHPLVMEDILTTDQRPKVEEYDDHLFVVLKMLRYDADAERVRGEQVSFVLTEDTVVSFQEAPGDVFDPVRDRLRHGKGKLRARGADYLLYALLDAIVDNYFTVLEQVGDDLEALEDGIVDNPKPETLQELHSVKQELIYLRKAVWPLREAVSRLERLETPLISDETRPYLRDVYDHTIQVIDIIESLRDVQGSTLDVYLSSVSNRMNEVMKVLTVIGSIFIPLTFIAGVYGMNFNPATSPLNMPELNWYWGYPAALAAMAALGVGMAYYFWQKDWF